MNKILLTTMILSASFAAKAQVAIGKTNPVTTPGSSVLLEFGTEAKDIIVPQVASAPGAAGGTFVFFDTTEKAMKVLEEKNNEVNNGWTNLTEYEDNGVAHSFSNAGTDVGNGVIIGASSTTKPGVLVLESTTRALVLPNVANPHTAIKSPIAGTIVYDTTADMLAVYDGARWSYWK